MDDAEPTKAADAADSESEQTAAIADSSETAPAELAWSAATEEQETGAISEKRSPALWLGPVMALLAAAIAVASALLFYLHRAPATTISTRAPAAPPLDGTYRLDYDFSRETRNGAANPEPNVNNTGWWAFRSSCTPSGCVGTGTKLDKSNPRLASTPSTTEVFHFVDGYWQGAPYQLQIPQPHPCLGANGEVIGTGENTEMVALSMDPLPDGTLRGVTTATTVTNECGTQGNVAQSPFVATRTGDVPPGISVADPTTVTASPATSTSAPTVAGPVLDGTFRVDFDYTKQTYNGGPITNPPPNNSLRWAFHSICTSAGCVATGAALNDENHQGVAASATDVLRFTDGHWQDTPYLRPPAQCAGPTNGAITDTVTSSWSFEPQPDGTLRGVQIVTTVTNECGGTKGTVRRTPISATRTGDVPPGVILADPALFTAPAKGPR
jgi:serine/threonine protein kinase, bacterial